MAKIARRDLVVSLAAILAGVTARSPGPAADQVPGRGRQEPDLLDILFPDPAAASHLGCAYLRAHPAELDIQQLRDRVLGTLHLPGGADATNRPYEAAVIARVRCVLTDDYLAGRVVAVDGWVLSVTEARLYALAALAQDRPCDA